MKYLFLILIYFFSFNLLADVIVNKVIVSCGNSETCDYYKDKLENLKGKYRNEVHLRKTLKLIFSSGGMKNLSFNYSNEELQFNFETKTTISDIQVQVKNSSLEDAVLKNLRLKIDSYLDNSEIQDEIIRIRESLRARGYANPKIESRIVFEDGKAIVIFDIDEEAPLYFSEVKIKTHSDRIKSIIQFTILDIKGKNYDQTYLRSKMDEIEKTLFDYGYYLVSVSHSVKIDHNKVNLEFIINGVEFFQFDIKEDGLDAKMAYIIQIKELFKRHKRDLDASLIDATIRDLLKSKAYFIPLVKVSDKVFYNKHKEKVKLTTIQITKGIRTIVERLKFKGNKNKSRNDLLHIYFDDAFELADGHFLDLAYLGFFKNNLKTIYIKDGYVLCDIADPKIEFSEDMKYAEVEFDILEGPKVLVETLSISGMDPQMQNEQLESLQSKQGKHFNPIQFEKDLSDLQKRIQEKGYYFAEISNLQDESLVVYSKNKYSVAINIKVRLNKWINLNNIIIVGNKITKESAIRKRIKLTHGDTITPQKLKAIEASLLTTGLFTSVKAKPISHTAKISLTDVMIELVESEYGLIEIAPGYRTDIGVKLSAQINYQNLWGLNKGVNLTGQINQRIDYQTFDPRRRKERKRLLEYNVSTTFTQADILNTYIGHSAALAFQRRRFYSFDADITRINNTISRELSTKLSASLRHQYESINQFDATRDRDNGSFQIGALTPILTADFRNNRINPTKGAFFNVSCEFANKYFLSQETDDVKINFYKFISRNRFYIPYKNGTVAISIVGGIQENLAKDPLMKNGQQVVQVDEEDPTRSTRLTEGYIPSIKVFRLTGTDIVRGFSDEEINRLSNGRNIGDDRVQNKAYMANFKLEPRYFINDTMITGVFFDAGRVYTDGVDLGDMRQSVGVTLKFLTPVGTLDLDYGYKLLRKELDGGKLESPGRFHVSIGFF